MLPVSSALQSTPLHEAESFSGGVSLLQVGPAEVVRAQLLVKRVHGTLRLPGLFTLVSQLRFAHLQRNQVVMRKLGSQQRATEIS